jgi:ribonuclease HI
MLRDLQARGVHPTVQWVPAHLGIEGNERADTEAKAAALQGLNWTNNKPIRQLAAAAKRRVRGRIKARWKKEWDKSKSARYLQRVVKAPGKATLEPYSGLPKPYSSVIIQLRSGWSALNHALFKIKKHPDGRCTCFGEPIQTSKHVLMSCERWTTERTEMWAKLAARTNVKANADYEALVTHPKAVRYVADFMLKTGLRSQFRDVTLEEGFPDEPEPGVSGIE